jgi:hypothetical protein
MGVWVGRAVSVVIMGLVLASIHTQAPLAASPGPTTSAQGTGQPSPEACPPPAHLVAGSITDAWTDVGHLITRDRDDITALATLVVAVFTGTLWWTTKGMMQVAEDQRRDSLEAIAASKLAAEAARKSAEVAERAFLEHERPWIFRSTVQMTPRGTPDVSANDWWISITWKHVGRTPALITACEFRFQDIEALTDSPDYSQCEQVGVRPSLAAGEDFPTPPVGLGRHRMRPDGTARQVVMYGRLTYTDMAGREHHSGFALELNPKPKGGIEHRNPAYNYYD